MSQAHFIVCTSCRTLRNVAQGPYCTNPDYLKENPVHFHGQTALNDFLLDHQSHPLLFVAENVAWDLIDCEHYLRLDK
jgi:hypothetical protein